MGLTVGAKMLLKKGYIRLQILEKSIRLASDQWILSRWTDLLVGRFLAHPLCLSCALSGRLLQVSADGLLVQIAPDLDGDVFQAHQNHNPLQDSVPYASCASRQIPNAEVARASSTLDPRRLRVNPCCRSGPQSSHCHAGAVLRLLVIVPKSPRITVDELRGVRHHDDMLGERDRGR
ncbi:hypothetical protein Fmac_011174 [Flemingia macrophylla]|uniref:Uncharacterized protein n=1 Tax=Flemingia macrophylla TaxID=520843 RepID=A0ABD1MLP4_9FABA